MSKKGTEADKPIGMPCKVYRTKSRAMLPASPGAKCSPHMTLDPRRARGACDSWEGLLLLLVLLLLLLLGRSGEEAGEGKEGGPPRVRSTTPAPKRMGPRRMSEAEGEPPPPPFSPPPPPPALMLLYTGAVSSSPLLPIAYNLAVGGPVVPDP